MSQLLERTAPAGGPAGDEAIPAEPRVPGRDRAAASLRVLGALAVLITGAVHLQQYLGVHFDVVPIIGPLFALNFAAATVIGLGLLVPHARMRLVHIVLALGGIGLAATSFVFLFVSEHRLLFGFQDYGYRPAIIVALVAEAAAVAFLAAYLAVRSRRD